VVRNESLHGLEEYDLFFLCGAVGTVGRMILLHGIEEYDQPLWEVYGKREDNRLYCFWKVGGKESCM
jgi:hypothetical protein